MSQTPTRITSFATDSVHGVGSTVAYWVAAISTPGVVDHYTRYRTNDGAGNVGRWVAGTAGDRTGSYIAGEFTGLQPQTRYEGQISLAADYSDPQTITFTTLAASVLEHLFVTNIVGPAVTFFTLVTNRPTTLYWRFRTNDGAGSVGRWTELVEITGGDIGFDEHYLIRFRTRGVRHEVQVSLSPDYSNPQTEIVTPTVQTIPPFRLLSVEAGIIATSGGQVGALVHATIEGRGRVYFRIRRNDATVGVGEWGIPRDSGTQNAISIVFGVHRGIRYEVEASPNQDFSDPVVSTFATVPGVLSTLLSGPHIDRIGDTTARAAATVSNPQPGLTFGWAYRTNDGAGNTGEWLHTSSASSLSTVNVDITGLIPGTRYEIRVTLPWGDSRTAFFTTTGTPPPNIVSLAASALDRATPLLTATTFVIAATNLYARIRRFRTTGWTNLTTQSVTADDPTAVWMLDRATYTPGQWEAEASFNEDFSDSDTEVFTILALPSTGASIRLFLASRLNTAMPRLTAFVSNAAADGTTPVYVRIRARPVTPPDVNWIELDSHRSTASGVVPHWDLDRANYPAGEYEAEASVNADYSDAENIIFTILAESMMPDPDPLPPDLGGDITAFGVAGLAARAPYLWYRTRDVLDASDLFLRIRTEPAVGNPGEYLALVPTLMGDGGRTVLRGFAPGRYRAQIALDAAFSNDLNQVAFTILPTLDPDVIPGLPDDVTGPEGLRLFIDVNSDGDPSTVLLTDEIENLMEIRAAWGRNEAAFLAHIVSARIQAILDNTSGRYDPGRMLPGARIRFDHISGGVGAAIVRGFVKSVQPSYDPQTGRRIVVISAEGAMARLARAEHDISLYTREEVRTGQVIEDALQESRFLIDREIDAGQVVLHPAHYTEILLPRALTRPARIIQATADAELGFVDEVRGDRIRFANRFARELDDRLSAYAFGSVPDSDEIIQVQGPIIPRDSWDNIWTAVLIGASATRTLAPGVVWSLGGPLTTDGPATFIVNLALDNGGRTNERVRSVAAWEPVQAGDIEVDPSSTVIRFGGETQSAISFSVDRACTITKLDIRARGVATFGLALPEIQDATAVARYDRRVLELPASFLGDALNGEGDFNAEAGAYAELLLLRFGEPQRNAPLQWNAFQSVLSEDAFRNIQTSDPVLVTGDLGIETGGYRVEGGELEYIARTRRLLMTTHLSRRNRRTFQRNQDAIIAGGAGWTDVARLNCRGPTVVAAEVSSPDRPQDDDPRFRILVGGVVRKAVLGRQIPAGSTFLGTFINPAASTEVAIQIQAPVTSTGVRIAQIQRQP